MDKPVIISGEASETDSEEDFNPKMVHDVTKSVQGAIITGEDSESENEFDSVASAISALNQAPQSDRSKEKSPTDSLFHQKLRKQNSQLHNDIENLCQSTVNKARKNLNDIDQQLLRSQFTVQNAVTSLKSLSVNSLTLKSKLHSLLSANFLSNVTVEK
ncbi:biogenesis of lysosome-related organelles complex 1, subunit 3 isoform X1 [Leptinotarsa decemlineata]|uniref:biogenesis of lysosome-related organelles complex 1, subunit 3 isoform X1 n=1 Tax=Leptinotarsa decemlineata TaxID=7539 RepID=UPI000C2529FC|nr:biogenesis of lysosome-related organelles complex 1 subunit 3 [Leptinotarsa decemlineata]